MVRIQWRIIKSPHRKAKRFITQQLEEIKLTCYTLFYNEFISLTYVGDVLLEPIFWFIDHFTKILGPIFVVGVCLILFSVTVIAYVIGLPYYWNEYPRLTYLLLVIGNWLLTNICFHFYMAASTSPGYPPVGTLIQESVSICKKCIAPKPPRTHHCSICDKCILKMDHHCPWLNNCVGHYNHRYFFLFCFYTSVGCLFLMVFGIEILYSEIYHKHSAKSGSNSTDYVSETPNIIVGSAYWIVLTIMNPKSNSSEAESDSAASEGYDIYRLCIIYESLISIGVFVALGALTAWHSKLISRGETSIEKHINNKETLRLRKLGMMYRNPYDFKSIQNWILFLGLFDGRTWLRNVILPSTHKPEGNGLAWTTNYSIRLNDVSHSKKSTS